MGVLERAVKWTRRNPLLGGMAAVVVVLALVSTLLAASLFLSRGEVNLALREARRRRRWRRREAARAEEQSRAAQAQRQRAINKEKIAETEGRRLQVTLAGLQEQSKAKAAADAKRQAELEKQVQLAESLKREEAKGRDASSARESRPTNGPQRPNKRCRP